MADTFDCPKCGAPVKYNSAEQGNLGTITCPYCGESIVIPAEMRPQPAASQDDDDDQEDREEDRKLVDKLDQEGKEYNASIAKSAKLNKTIGIIGMSIGAIAVIAFVIIPIIIAIVSGGIALLANSSSASSTRTAAVNLAATRTAQNALFSEQGNWPVVIQDGFTDNKLNWSTGTDNNDMALEQKTISGGKYTWELTSKQGMGAFSYPDMPVQKDIYVSVDLQMTTTGHSLDDNAGITFRHSDTAKSFYYFGVSPNGGFSLSLYDGSNWDDLLPAANTTAVKPDQINHLAVSMAGSQILLLINNQIVGSYEDDQLTSGYAGLGINFSEAGTDTTATFTNFYVKAPKN